MSPHSIIRMCVCVCPWQLALQKEGRRQQMDEIRAVRTVEQLLFALSWSQKWLKTGPKNGAAILPEEGKASKMAAPFLGPGCCIHSQPPLRAVSSRDSGTCRLFSWQWA